MKKADNPEKPVGITLGDPAGVGPEILVLGMDSSEIFRSGEKFVIVGHEKPLRRAQKALGIDLSYEKVSLPLEGELPPVALLEPGDVEFPEKVAPGKPDPDSGWLSYRYLEIAAGLAVEGRFKALVTLPVSKSFIARRVPDFRGHTEYLQQKTGAGDVRMMLGTEGLRIALATTHLPLGEVPGLLTVKLISDTIRITHDALKLWLHRNPLIVVCALNPHAGDSGLLGDEENDVILPGVIHAESLGCQCVGPYPADTALAMTAEGRYDAAVAMYHDQALIALKLTHPNRGANITLGLPFVRTSPLHGTGFDIAGKGIAVENSFVDALKSALVLAERQS